MIATSRWEPPWKTIHDGVLTVAINYGNAVLAFQNESGSPAGVSVEIARRISSHLRLECQFVTFNAAMDATAAVGAGDCDLGFFAIDPARADKVAFTHPYLTIRGHYLVRQGSAYFCNEDIDRSGVSISVAKGSAYDLFLTRVLKNATLIRESNSSREVVDTFLRLNLDVAAGIQAQLVADATRFGGLRLINPYFMLIQQAMGIPKSHGTQPLESLNQFITQSLADKFFAKTLKRHGVEGVDLTEDTTQ